MTKSWMSDSDYGGEEKGTVPREHLNYGEKDQNMKGDTFVDLKDRVLDALRQDPDVDATKINVNIKENNIVELSGTVPDSRSMERAVECVRALGLTEIDNDLSIQLA